MLKRENRITDAKDFRAGRKKALRVRTAHTVVYIKAAEGASRFGFVVPNTVGKAVVRNGVKRRMREIAAEVIKTTPTGLDVIVQADINAASATFADLRTEILGAVARARR